jgi:transposase-like protein
VKKFWEADSERARDSYLRLAWHERCEPKARRDYRNGCYLRSFSTRLGTVRVRIARSRGRAFLPQSIEAFQRRAEDVMILIREAFLRGISTQKVGRIVAAFPAESVSAQTVSKLTCDLDQGN